MPATNGEENSHQPEPNWVDKWMLYISAAGVVAVLFYACEAHKQNKLIAQSVAQEVLSNRPVMYHAGVDWSEKTPDGVPKKVKVNWENFGKSLAITVVTAGHIFVRSPGDTPPVDSDCDKNRIKLPKTGRTDAVALGAMAEPHWLPAEGEDLSDFKSSGKVLYVSGCIYYFGIDGKERYFSDLCVVWAPDAAQDFPTCDDPNRNYVW